MEHIERLFSLKTTKVLTKTSFGLLGFAIAVIFLGILGSLFRVALDLPLFFTGSIEVAVQHMIVNLIAILALVEVLKTVQVYISRGRIKVTYVIDTVLIVLLNEVLSAWYQHMPVSSVIVLLSILASLVAMRIATIRFSPKDHI